MPFPSRPDNPSAKDRPTRGWFDYSDRAIFNADRTPVTISLTDGGLGDEDGVASHVIVDPSSLGLPAAATSQPPGGGGGSGGGGFTNRSHGPEGHGSSLFYSLPVNTFLDQGKL